MTAFREKIELTALLMLMFLTACTPANWLKLSQPLSDFSNPNVIEYVGFNDFEIREVEGLIERLDRLYGQPVYRHHLVIRVVDDDAIDARAINLLKPGKRQILVNRFFLGHSDGFNHVIAHELFHALYQSEGLVKVMPDMVLEGMAMLVEFQIKYPGLSQERIRELFETKVIAEHRYYKKVDLEMPFSMYDKQDRRYLYSLAGLLMASQDPSVISKFINRKAWKVNGDRGLKSKFSELKVEPVLPYVSLRTSLLSTGYEIR